MAALCPTPPRAPPDESPVVSRSYCEPCHEAGARCDRTLPACGHCVEHDVQCWRNFKFHVPQAMFVEEQQWVETPRNLEFHVLVATDIEDKDDPAFSHRSVQWPLETQSSPEYEANISPDNPTGTYQEWEPAVSTVNPAMPVSPEGGPVMVVLTLGPSAEAQAALPQIYTETSVFPLQIPQQAMLVQYFVDKLAVWLDICEPVPQFGMLVPERAATCSTLLNAIMVLSAKHMEHQGIHTDSQISEVYHQRCLQVLIPLLNDARAIADENLFAATIILRVWEEMDWKQSGVDERGYLMASAFVHTHGDKIHPGTLAATCFWVGLRQEIYYATMNQKPVRLQLLPALMQAANFLGPGYDHHWANCAVAHCAEVLNFCYGPPSSPHPWDDLELANRLWYMRCPMSYLPTFRRDRGPGEAFPVVQHNTSWEVTGVQHLLLAQLFLLSRHPMIPRGGIERFEALEYIRERVCYIVREICGIGLSNPWTPPGMFTACMAIAAFGEWFLNRTDQAALMDVLTSTEHQHGRPTASRQYPRHPGTLGTFSIPSTPSTLGTFSIPSTFSTLGTFSIPSTFSTLSTLGTLGTFGTFGTLGTFGTFGTLGTFGTSPSFRP